MQLEKFQTGNYTKQGDFNAFNPAPVDLPWEWRDTSLNFLLERASAEIGGLKPRKENDLLYWIKFFLTAAIDTAKSAKAKFSNAVKVVNQLNERADNVKGRIENVRAILNAFYLEPMLGMKEIGEKTNLPQATVSVIVNDMQKIEILMETTGFSRNKVFMLKDYVDAFKISE